MSLDDLLAACADNNASLAAAEARLARVKLVRNRLALRAVQIDAVEQVAAALRTTPAKVRQMAIAAELPRG